MSSIQRHMTAWLMMAVVSLATVGNALLYFRVRTTLRREFDRRLLSDARALSRLIAYDEKARLELEIPARELSEFQVGNRPAYFELWKTDGTLFFRSPSLGKGDLDRAGGRVAWYTILPDGRAGRATALTFMPHLETDEPAQPGESAPKQEVAPTGEVTLILAYDVDDMSTFLRYLVAGQAAGTVVLALLCAGLVNWVVRRGLRPLHTLGEEAAAFNPDQLQRRFHVAKMPRELAPIVARLNDLLDRISGAFNRERRFTANAAHELRTPIAELRTCAEVALRTLPADGGEEAGVRADFEEVLAIARQMEHLTRALLAIARSEQPGAVNAESMALGEVIGAVKKRHEAAAAARGLRIACTVTEGPIVTDRMILEALLHNLLANAVAYAPGGTEICLRAGAAGALPRVEIENEAPGLGAEDVGRVFEPFWRQDAARTSGEHAGLGLSVAETYARALGLTLKATLSAGRFTTRLGPAEARTGAG